MSERLSPLTTDEVCMGSEISIVDPPKRFTEAEKEEKVRVEGSKKRRVTMLPFKRFIPLREMLFLSLRACLNKILRSVWENWSKEIMSLPLKSSLIGSKDTLFA